MQVGTEWLIDAEGCPAEKLRDLRVVQHLCRKVIEDLDLHVVGDGICHVFPPPGGITALYLLTESHLACHTYPEYGMATFNLYCCRSRPGGAWEQWLRDQLGAERVAVRMLTRGENVEITTVLSAGQEVARW
jgi:S-adenosylmethionine decarboxylase